MRWTRSLINTLREEPQEAEIASHKLMLRAGLIRRLGGGLYTFLPLGLRDSLDRAAQVAQGGARAAAVDGDAHDAALRT